MDVSLFSTFPHSGFGQLINTSEILSWYTDPASETIVEKCVMEATAAATRKFKDEEIHSYQNWSRNSSLESRYGKERLEKLRTLKKKWDPKGVFTKQLL
jgi:FAD/FMN-containing dehydrogenase